MSGKPISDISTALSIRLPNAVCEMIREYAEQENIINATGRMDKRGEVNMSQAISTIVNAFFNGSVVQSDNLIVSHTIRQDISSLVETQVKELADRLNKLETLTTELDFETLKNDVAAISDRLNQIELGRHVAVETGKELVQHVEPETLSTSGHQNQLTIEDAIAPSIGERPTFADV